MLPIISILVLVAVILLAWKYNWNPGLLGFMAAFLLGFFIVAGKNNAIVSSVKGGCALLFSGFNYKLWLRIMLVAIFFAIGQLDGTLEVLTKKFVALIHGRNKLLPIIFYLLTAFIAAIGAGSIGVLILIMPIAAAMVKEQKLDFMLTGLCVAIGGAVGGVSPMAATGIVGISVAQSVGIEVGTGIFTHYIVCGSLTILILYTLFGGWKYPNSEVSSQEAVKFNTTQKKTLAVIILFAILATLGYEIAFVAGLGIAILCTINKGVDQKKIIMMAPWYTLVLLGGMGVLVTTINAGGGIKLLTGFFQQFMGPHTAGVVITLVSGIMSFVASASGVVMPTLIPTVPDLAAATGATPLGLINAITFGAHQTGISPFSTGGSLVLSMGGDNIDQKKTFNMLIVTAIGILLIGCVYSYFGLLG